MRKWRETGKHSCLTRRTGRVKQRDTIIDSENLFIKALSISGKKKG